MSKPTIRKALREDVPGIVQLLANDPLGHLREKYQSPLPASYYDAFDRIASDPNNELIVACTGEKVIGTLQLTFLHYLTYQGGTRAQIEAVRIHEDHRSQGIGEVLIRWAIQRAEEKGAHLVQLTSDKNRERAIRFYEKLGFKASHEGMKLKF